MSQARQSNWRRIGKKRDLGKRRRSRRMERLGRADGEPKTLSRCFYP
jgi:hypothetical protein